MAQQSETQALDIHLFKESDLLSHRLSQAACGFVILGLLIRIVRYLLCFPLWPDESFLAVGFLKSSYGDLLGALPYHQVAPLLFLWTELAIVKILGFSEYSLRLFPFLCSIGSLFLFYYLARRLLKGAPLLLAVAIFAVSYYHIRHGAEIKPYATDVVVSLVLLTLAVEWWLNPARTRWLWLLSTAAPFAVGLSFPAVFIAGGISLGILKAVWERKSPGTTVAYLVFNLSLAAAFLLIYAVSTGPQYTTESWLSGQARRDVPGKKPGQEGVWAGCFPPLKNPWKLMVWLLKAHTGRLYAYPNGGNNGGSIITFVCFVAGGAVLFRQNRKVLLWTLLAPMFLTFIAAALHRYPYGHSTRFNLYLAPIICLLSGLGMARLIALIRSEKIRSRVFAAAVVLSALAGAAMILLDLVHPYKEVEDKRSRDFARRFWIEKGQDGELACVFTDLGKNFYPKLFEWGNSARYLCHQRIYSPLHRPGPRSPSRALISADRPLRCVVFSIPESLFPFARRDEKAWQAWMAEMEARYQLVDQEKHEVNSMRKGQHETYEVYDFVPRGDGQ